MYISDLKIYGFKSFANKEKLIFGEGTTVVVGPNGCGKTNIVDAVRWVLGEQKYSMLRSNKMEDIIFNGSATKKPLNVCEVSLTVHNNKGILPIEYADVEITRRIFRNGDSEYMINRSPCRLKDIQNLFADTGMGADAYSVIELKMVEQILSESGDDRRRMFEEAAGINRYRQQRKSAIKKFDAVRGDLNRVNDIITEVETRVHSLSLQLKRYDRHAVLSEKLKNRELELAYLRIKNLFAKLEPVKERIVEIKLQKSTKVDEEKGQETLLEGLQKTYHNQQKELQTIQTELNKLIFNRQELSDKILVLSEQVKSAQRTIERLGLEEEESAKKIDANKFQIKELNIELESIKPKILGKSKEYNAKKVGFDKINEIFTQAENKVEYLSNRRLNHIQKITSVRSLTQRTQDMLAEKMSKLNSLEQSITDLEKNQNDLEKSQKKLEKARGELQSAVTKDRKRLDTTDKEIHTLRDQKHELSLEFHRIANQVESLESQLQFYKEIMENQEGYPSGVRHILSNLEQFPDVIGSVADVIQVNEKYRPAIEAALGDISQCLVCKTRESALMMLEKIASENVGKVSFIPLDSRVFKSNDTFQKPKIDGVVGIASDLVKCDKAVLPLVNLLLNKVVVVENSEVADTIWKEGAFKGHIADLSGRYYDRNGVISSIKGEGEVGVIGRREKIDHLDQDINKLIKISAKNQEKAQNVDEALDSKESEQNRLSNELGKQIDELAVLERNITRNEYDISRLIESLQTVTHEIVAHRQEISNLEKSVDKLLPELKELEDQETIYQGKIEDAKKALQAARQNRDQENTIIQELRFELVSLENEQDTIYYKVQGIEGNIEELEQRIIDLTEEKDDLHIQSEQMTQEINIAEKELHKLNGEIHNKTSVKDLKDNAYSDTYNQIETLQNKIRNEQREREQLSEELKKYEIQAADYNSRIDLEKSRLKDKYDIKIPKVMDLSVSEDELTLQIDRIERSIERIGPINMAVKDEYEEENSRMEFLKNQRDDLIESEMSLLETIRRIDGEARRQFIETFDKIRENFKKTFTMFFEGGEGDLQLRGDEDPLDADIIILAKPPGKRNQNLRMLSAGEKALTSIALLFSIYLVKPSPFCILDEVDAPLDDNNIAKFTRVLNKFADETQFIIVTHNKLTMESAQYLYGVTMEQAGVSKIVSVQFD